MGFRIVMVMTLCVAVAGCDGDGDESVDQSVQARCTRMRDHLIELRLATVAPRNAPTIANVPGASRTVAVTPTPSQNVDLRGQHRAALVASLGDDFAERCAQSMSTAQIDCVTSAPDQEGASACHTAR